ncbi:aKG-HExxH-type peptide beta-hydroxylase [Rhizocola hellebori]|nr:HEXXH motif-containing putative peptide modification protein [Rhizocola hellebori]
MPTSEPLSRAVDVLSEAQLRSPQQIACLSNQAWSGHWIARCIEALKAPQTNRRTLDQSVARLGAFAAVAALRAGVDAETRTVTDSGCLVLPTLGVAIPCDGSSLNIRLVVKDGRLTIHCDGNALTVQHGQESASTSWIAMRRLTAMHGQLALDLAFDDLDPLRDCYGARTTGRVPSDQYGRWNELFLSAWQLLCRHSPQRAAQVSQIMQVLVPLAPQPGLAEISMTSQDAMGALAMTLPTDPARFAIALVHEQAHSTLNGLLNLMPLFDRRSEARYFAPWRPDARPIGGLLHGVYAFLAVAETWLDLSEDTRIRQTAENELALRRVQVDTALDILVSADSLTPEGVQFAKTMRHRCDLLMAQPIPASVAAHANDVLRAQHKLWRQRNRQQ